jgi:outer membrane protein assembly factor BamB
MVRQAIISIVLCGFASCQFNIALADSDETWPQWRGTRRDGSVVAPAWPNGLQDTVLKQMWRLELPPSFSGPVVGEDTVFVTFTDDEKSEGVVALDRRTGDQRWKAEWEATMTVAELGTSMGSWIRATPSLSGQQLFVAGMPDLLVCLDTKTGNQQWQVDFCERYGTPLPELGLVSSPLVDDDGVYVQAADSFVKVNKNTGNSIWRSLERDDKGQGSYSSPELAVIHGRRQLLVANIDDIAGVDPKNGNVLWKRTLDSYDQGCIIAPIAYQGGIFTSTRASRTGYYPLEFTQEQFTLHDGWTNKLVVYMSSPIVIGDFAYMHLKNGRFACVDLRNGTIKWTSNRPFGKYCSLAWNQDTILSLTNEGQLLLIKANPDEFELLDSRTISDQETWGHIAIAGKQIFIREKNAITAFQWTGVGEEAEAPR